MAFPASRQPRTGPSQSRKRSCRRIAAASFLASATLFAASPLSALWSLSDAVRQNDVRPLREGMDWRALRTALKGDLAVLTGAPRAADPVLAQAEPIPDNTVPALKLASAHIPMPSAAAAPEPASDDDALPEFGSSFVTHVVSNAVDDEVTPEHLLVLLHGNDATAPAPLSVSATLHRLRGLRFSSPDRFELAFATSDQPDAAPVRVSMRIEQWRWKIVAIHLPDAAPAAPPAPIGTRPATPDLRRT